MQIEIFLKDYCSGSQYCEYRLTQRDRIHELFTRYVSSLSDYSGYSHIIVKLDTGEIWEYEFPHKCQSCGVKKIEHYSHTYDRDNPIYCKFYCRDCCNHLRCGCGDHADYPCNTCNTCDSCCTCVRCEDCNNRVHREDTCGYCADHCNCGSREFTYRVSDKFKSTAINNRKQFRCSRSVGVEWEYNTVAGDYVIDWANRWKGGINYDGSCGFEAVTPPLAGDQISKCLSQLSFALEAGGAVIDNRCSIHVHVDASDYTWSDMYRLLRVYALVEPVLYLLGGQNRLENTRYCAPCGNDFLNALLADDKKAAVMAIAFRSDRNAARVTHRSSGPNKKAAGRYRGLNICPWLAGKKDKAQDTTVEFRIHRDTAKGSRVTNWTQLCALIVDWCSGKSDRDIEQLPKSPLRALCTVIAPEKKDWILSRVKLWRKYTKPKKRKIRIAKQGYIVKTNGVNEGEADY